MNTQQAKRVGGKRHLTRTWLFAGGVVLLLGVLLFAVGMTALGWDFNKLDNVTYTEKGYAYTDEAPVTRVELDVDSFPVEVTSGDTLSLRYYEASDSKVEITCEDGVLKIKERSSFNLIKNGWFNFGRSKHTFQLHLPAGLEVVIDSTNADIELIDITSENMSIDATNADVILRHCTFAGLQIKSTNADVVLLNCEGGEVHIESTNLDLEVAGVGFASLYARGTNVDAEIEGVVIPVVELRGTNADFKIDRLTVDTLTVHGTNLDADINILGEKSEYTITTSGKHLPSEQTGTTDKSIDISGTNNDVELSFGR